MFKLDALRKALIDFSEEKIIYMRDFPNAAVQRFGRLGSVEIIWNLVASLQQYREHATKMAQKTPAQVMEVTQLFIMTTAKLSAMSKTELTHLRNRDIQAAFVDEAVMVTTMWLLEFIVLFHCVMAANMIIHLLGDICQGVPYMHPSRWAMFSSFEVLDLGVNVMSFIIKILICLLYTSPSPRDS